MKPYKMHMTRPEFLAKFILDEKLRILSFEEVARIIPGSYDLLYCAYTALIDADIESELIDYVNVDSDTVSLQLISKSIAKQIAELCNKDKVRIGEKKYKVRTKTHGSTLEITVELTNPEVLHNMIIQTDQYDLN